MKFKFDDHKYNVVCLACGRKQTNEDSGVAAVVDKVTVSSCKKCSPDAYSGTITQICYDKDGNKL